jgi:hypothetical protein
MAKSKPKKPRARRAPRPRKPTGGGKPKSNAWRQYVGGGVSNAPLPD